MNRLTDALKLAEDAQPGPVARTAGRPADPAAPGERQLDSIRVTRDDPIPSTSPPASLDADDCAGPEMPSGWWLEPIRATRDDGAAAAAALDHEFAATEPSESAHPALSDAPCEELNADAAAFDHDFEATKNSEPARSTLSGAPSESAGGRPSDGGVAQSVMHRRSGPRTRPRAPARTPTHTLAHTLARRRGIGRLVGTALSLLAVIGAVAGGGYFIWRTELVRPALVRRLPPLPGPVMDLVPVHTASAAVNDGGETAEGGGLRADTGPAVARTAPGASSPWMSSAGLSASRAPDEPRGTVTVEPSTAQHTAWPRPVSIARTSASRSPPDPRAIPVSGRAAPGRVEPKPAAGGSPDTIVHPAAALEQDAAEPRPDSGSGIAIRKWIRTDHVAATLERAYAAFLAGDGVSATEAYRSVLGHEPENRDAHFGLAAVAARAGRWDEAAGHYARILASHPADTVAQAAIIAIEEQDPARGERRLKALLRSEPQAAHLHFNLGNLYAAQSRWPEAQQSYFNAHRFDRGNPDYAHNLAVSLDHLSQSESALGLYREALVLSSSRPASFEATAVRQRIRDLDTPAEAGAAPIHPASTTAAGARAVPIR